ncbi:MAG: hypothetical protein KF708_14925 [Pirellulales bacterium]|nr:hypothetical protein [Pirellulales bacterium]
MNSRLFLFLLLGITSSAYADDVVEKITAARQAATAGDLDRALELLDPLLELDPVGDENIVRARRAAANLLHLRGSERFREAKIQEAITDYDREIELVPELAPGHWQRGIAYYYAEAYQKGVDQFALHQTVNPQDVENAVWHFLCAVRAPDGSVAKAREHLIPITEDPRVPMHEIHRLFAGEATPADVSKAAEGAGTRARFYADLYLGLYYEVLGKDAESLCHIEAAAKSPAAEGSNMGDIARVHYQLRTKATKKP